MASLNMNGPYHFTEEDILNEVTQIKPGNYALGYLKKNSDEKDVFIVQYVGRSDSDVAERILQHLGEPYKHFKYSYATSPRAAFLQECQNYHDFGEKEKLKNKIHPDKPAGTNWKCPCCEKSAQ